MFKVPLTMEAEYRGVAPEGSFVNDGGETIDYGKRRQFEVELPDGDVCLIKIADSALDKCVPPIDAEKLKRGDRVHFEGIVGGDAYFKPFVAEVVAANGKPLNVAA